MSRYNTAEACHQRKDTKLVLKYVNRIRAQFGMVSLSALYKGEAGEHQNCSIARSLSGKYVDAEVRSDYIDVTRYSRVTGNRRGRVVQKETFKTPGYVADWIAALDGGQLPGLVV